MDRKKILEQRIRVLRSMDEVAHTINDEEIFEIWLAYGVPDEEIQPETADDELIWLVEDDEEWQELLDTFNRIMYLAYKGGGLWTL